MSAPRAVRRLLVVTALAFASTAGANALPPGPVLGHPAHYVIVTPAAFVAEFQTLARWKTRQGLPAFVKTMESIVAEYPGGRDDAERVRMFLQDAHAQWGTRWVLLGGVPPFVPVRLAHTTFYGGLDTPSDLYFSCLQGNWDADGDGIFGEGFITDSDPGDAVDLHPDVFVGRAPVRSATEARDFVGKTLRAGFQPYVPTPHTALLAADVLFPRPWHPGDYLILDGAEIVEAAAGGLGSIPGVDVERLYQNWTAYPGAAPLTGPALLAALRAGTDFFLLSDLGNASLVVAGPDTLYPADFAALTDAPRPTSAYLMSESTEDFSGEAVPLAFVRGATGGAATCIAPSSIAFPTAQRNFLNEYVRLAYPPNAKAVGEANALSKLPFIPFSAYDGVNRVIEMEMNLVGDPETRLRPSPPPPPLAVAAPAVAAAGPPGFAVEVSSEGAPVAGARVCVLIEDEALAIATTDASGHAALEMPAGSAGPADVTVIGPDGAIGTGTLVVGAVTGVGDLAPGARFATPQPNPAFTATRLSGNVSGPAALEIFDVGGRRMRSFALETGAFDLRWDLRDATGRRVAPGLYLARLGSADGVQTQRLLVAR